jgi:hypothetical protein
MAVRTCKVSCRDAAGIEHSVQVTAQTLYEAVAQALRVFREHDWCGKDLRGSAASVLVKITPPEVEHRVRLRDFASWLESAGKKPCGDDTEESAAANLFRIMMCCSRRVSASPLLSGKVCNPPRHLSGNA